MKCASVVLATLCNAVMLGATEHSVTYITILHVLHVEAVLSLFAFLVLLLLTAAFLNDTEAAGEDEEGGHYSDGDERPWRHCRASWDKNEINLFRRWVVPKSVKGVNVIL